MNYQRLYESAEKQRRFAWAKYYERVNNDLHGDRTIYQTITRTSEDMPTHIKNEFIEMATALKKKWECPICLDFIPNDALEITPCGHFYCKGCLAQVKAQGDPKCSICRRKLRG